MLSADESKTRRVAKIRRYEAKNPDKKDFGVVEESKNGEQKTLIGLENLLSPALQFTMRLRQESL